MDAVQKKIDALHQKQLDETRKLALECNLKKNEAFAARSKMIKEKAPKDFWFKVFSGHPDFASELLGEYDEKIFAALESFEVVNKPDGFRIEMNFGPNEYFTNTTLWYEEKEEAGKDPQLSTSGVAWKPGKGPSDESEFTATKPAKEANPWLAAAKQVEQQKASGARREREEEGRGVSFFSFFDEVPAEPTADSVNGGKAVGDDGAAAAAQDDYFGGEAGGDQDDALFADALDEWDQIIDERREIARCICDEIWDDPAQYIKQE